MDTETKTGHTPGPWTVETVPTACGICHKIGPFPTARPRDTESYACVYVDGIGAHAPALKEMCERLRNIVSPMDDRQKRCLEEADALLASIDGDQNDQH